MQWRFAFCSFFALTFRFPDSLLKNDFEILFYPYIVDVDRLLAGVWKTIRPGKGDPNSVYTVPLSLINSSDYYI